MLRQEGGSRYPSLAPVGLWAMCSWVSNSSSYLFPAWTLTSSFSLYWTDCSPLSGFDASCSSFSRPLNIGRPWNPVLGPLVFFLCPSCLGQLSQFSSLEGYLCTDNSPNFTSRINLSPQLQSCESSGTINLSNLAFPMEALLAPPRKQAHAFLSVLHLTKWHHHPPRCLGEINKKPPISK